MSTMMIELVLKVLDLEVIVEDKLNFKSLALKEKGLACENILQRSSIRGTIVEIVVAISGLQTSKSQLYFVVLSIIHEKQLNRTLESSPNITASIVMQITSKKLQRASKKEQNNLHRCLLLANTVKIQQNRPNVRPQNKNGAEEFV
ncbi:hypothetical protein HELRODRAFT_178534 [Helobdella robusta]|uniref:Uncharacterized protein n=1 Tax=Helobdella robusta TaxID=6412 RepID=T1FDB9_HELRO|nr:hypothetical protein HELRODRAFT_178534 [Helobdella robusta]ESN97085.1 hypothetical protein HELRODRAFT_178534 [Helobdella robusta]